MEGLVIALIRIAGSLPVLRWAFVGGLIAVFVDLSDLFIRQAIDLGGLSNYQEWDKWVDQVYIWLFLIVALQWSGWERRVALGLFGWRFIGFIAFAAGAGRDILIFFPHVFEFWFLFVAARPHWPAKLRPGWAQAADGTPAPPHQTRSHPLAALPRRPQNLPRVHPPHRKMVRQVLPHRVLRKPQRLHRPRVTPSPSGRGLG